MARRQQEFELQRRAENEESAATLAAAFAYANNVPQTASLTASFSQFHRVNEQVGEGSILLRACL